MDAHEMNEHHEHIREAAETHHGSSRSKRIAILISVLAALLALVEIGGKSAQTTAMVANLDASNLWAFFQAKTIRMTTLRTTADALELVGGEASSKDPAWAKRIADWRATVQRYDSEPDTGEGRQELAARAKAAEAHRDHSLAAYHLFEIGTGALEIGIVLASAAVVTGVLALAWLAAAFGATGSAIGLLAWLAPTLVHF
jgi:hypothetical protein